MYYRVAIQMDATPTWQWKSTALSSLNKLLQWLQFYQAFPHDRLRIFSSSSHEELNEQLVRENRRLSSTSVPATQFLQERRIAPQGMVRVTAATGTRANERMAPVAAVTELSLGESSRESQSLDGRGVSFLEKRRVELEHGAGGDHDLPYRFTLPIAMPQVLVWMKLLAMVQNGDIQP
jgi:hypothetical protein